MRESLEEFERQRQREQQEQRRRSKCQVIDTDRGSQLFRIRDLQYKIDDLKDAIDDNTNELLRERISAQTSPDDADISSRIDNLNIRRDRARSEFQRVGQELERAKDEMRQLRSDFFDNGCFDWFDPGPED